MNSMYFMPMKLCEESGCKEVAYSAGPPGDLKWRCQAHQKQRAAQLERIIDAPERVKQNLCPPPWRA